MSVSFYTVWYTIQAFSTLLVDIFSKSPSTAAAAGNITRCMLSALTITGVQPLADAMGMGWFFHDADYCGWCVWPLSHFPLVEQETPHLFFGNRTKCSRRLVDIFEQSICQTSVLSCLKLRCTLSTSIRRLDWMRKRVIYNTFFNDSSLREGGLKGCDGC